MYFCGSYRFHHGDRAMSFETFCNSLEAATIFEQKHYKTLKDIRQLECSEHFRNKNLLLDKYKDAQGKERPMYLMTKSGLMLLIMCFRGRKSPEFKIRLINRYNELSATCEALGFQGFEEINLGGIS